jgi:hypothetical protein
MSRKMPTKNRISLPGKPGREVVILHRRPLLTSIIGFRPALHGFWHFWHFLIFSSIHLTDAWLRPLAGHPSHFLCSLGFSLSSTDLWRARGFKQAPPRRGLVFLFFFMDDPVFLIFIMPRAHGQMLSM